MTCIGDFDSEIEAKKKFPKYFDFFEASVSHVVNLNKAQLIQLYIEKTDKGENFEFTYSLEDTHPDGWEKHMKDLNDKFPGAHPLEFTSVRFIGSNNNGKWNIEGFEVTVD